MSDAPQSQVELWEPWAGANGVTVASLVPEEGTGRHRRAANKSRNKKTQRNKKHPLGLLRNVQENFEVGHG